MQVGYWGGLFLLQNWQLCCGKVYLLERLGAGDVESTSTVLVTNVVLLTTLWLDPTNMPGSHNQCMCGIVTLC